MSKNNLYDILQACDSIKTLEEEFNSPLGRLKILHKRKFRELKGQLVGKINHLMDDKWTVEYLKSMELVLLSYYDKLEPYMDDIAISDPNDRSKLYNFKPMYFSESHGHDVPFNTDNNYDIKGKDKNRMYILEILGDTITFTIYDCISDQRLEIMATGETSKDQEKVVIECKMKIIYMLNRYLEDISHGPSLSHSLMDKIKHLKK